MVHRHNQAMAEDPSPQGAGHYLDQVQQIGQQAAQAATNGALLGLLLDKMEALEDKLDQLASGSQNQLDDLEPREAFMKRMGISPTTYHEWKHKGHFQDTKIENKAYVRISTVNISQSA